MNFYFQSGDFSIPDASSFWESLIGALIGAAAALSIYFLETNRERKKERNLKIEINKKTLSYFTSLIDSIILFGENQSKFYLEHANNIDQNPLDFNKLKTQTIVEDLNRALNKFEHERLFHSYLEAFGNNKSKVKTFQKIFSRLDYMNKIQEDVIESQEKYINELTDRIYKFKDLTEEQIINSCSILTNNIKHTDPNYLNNDFYNTLNKSLIYFYDNKPKPMPLAYIQQGFIDRIKIELVRKFRHIKEGYELVDNCRKATWLYNETIFRAKVVSHEFKDYHNGLELATSELKSLTSDLVDQQ